MTKLERLRKQAREACTFRKHTLGPFKYTRNNTRGHAKCPRCNHCVFINTRPAPNEIPISGEAVALHCREEEKKP